MKPLISWNARDVGTTLVERIGIMNINILKVGKDTYLVIEFTNYYQVLIVGLQLKVIIVYYFRRFQRKL